MTSEETQAVDIVHNQRGVPVPRTLGEQLALAEVVIKSGLSLGHKTKESVVIAIQFGAELGLLPLQSLRMVNVINGKPSLNADGCVGVVLASGKAEYFVPEEVTADHATFVTKRRGAPKAVRYTFTMAQAIQAKLPERNPTYRAFPERMLSSRAKSFLGRDVYPDVLGGTLSVEELEDLEPSAPEPAPIALPRRVGEEAPALAASAEPTGNGGEPVDTANGDLFDEPAPPTAATPAPAATRLPPADPCISEKERAELYRLCNRHGRSHAELRKYLMEQGCKSAMAIPTRLLEATRAWVQGTRDIGEEG